MSSKLAIVTGASAGIGWELSKQLARRGYDLWLVARRGDRLRTLAGEIRETERGDAEPVPLDLASPTDRRKLTDKMERAENLSLLVNNAGFGAIGSTIEVPLERVLGLIELNITALTELTHSAARILAARGSGGIINVASTASFQPVPYLNVYSATKAYVLSFTAALSAELAETGVRVMALCPGPTQTEFNQVAGVRHEDFRSHYAMTAEECARIGLNDFERGEIVSITGTANKLQVFASWLSPRSLVLKAAAKVMKGRGQG